MIRGLITGALYGEPESRTSRNGAPYALATVRVADGDRKHWIKLFAFGDLADDLLACKAGQSLSATGSLAVDVYAPEGKPARPTLSMVADHVIALRREYREAAKRRAQADRSDA